MSGPVVNVLERDFDETWAQNGPVGDLAFLKPGRANAVDNEAMTGQPLRLLYSSIHDSQIYRANRNGIPARDQ